MTTEAGFDTKMQELIAKVQELEDKTAAFKAFVQPSFEITDFHKHYDPVTETAKAAHDIYHELLGLRGHAH
jgi:hypothetical protein